MRPPMAFLSYARFDDEHDEGSITKIRQRLSGEVQMHTGEPFPIFQDRTDIRWGEEWAVRIEREIGSVTFFLPVLTPSFFRSSACRRELETFLAHERKLGRSDLILPLYYLECPLLEDAALRASDSLATALASRQYVDWRELRFESPSGPQAARRLAEMARHIRDSLNRSYRPDGHPQPYAAGQDRAEGERYLGSVAKAKNYLDKALLSLPGPERDLLIRAYELDEEGYRVQSSRNILFSSKAALSKALIDARTQFLYRLVEIIANSDETGEMADILVLFESWIDDEDEGED